MDTLQIEQQAQLSFMDKARRFAARGAMAVGLTLGVGAAVESASPVDVYADCASNETLMPIYEDNLEGSLIIVGYECVYIPGGGSQTPVDNSPGNGNTGQTPSGNNNSGGNNSSPSQGGNTAPDWEKDIKPFAGCAPGLGEPSFADQLIVSGVTAEGKRLVDLIENCPSSVWISLIGNADADITVSPEAQVAIDARLLELSAPASTEAPTTVSTDTVVEQGTTTEETVDTTAATTTSVKQQVATTTTAVAAPAIVSNNSISGPSSPDIPVLPITLGIAGALTTGVVVITRHKKAHQTA